MALIPIKYNGTLFRANLTWISMRKASWFRTEIHVNFHSLNKALGYDHTTDFGRGFCVQLRLFSAIYSYKGKFRLSVLTTVARFPKIGHVHSWHSFHVKTASKTTMAAMGLIRAVKQWQKTLLVLTVWGCWRSDQKCSALAPVPCAHNLTVHPQAVVAPFLHCKETCSCDYLL